jgi:hypothetical protein
MGYIVAGIDIHKKVLMVVVTDASTGELRFKRFRCGTTAGEREVLLAWLQKHEVQELVMESTAQYFALSSALIGRVQVPPALR